MAARAPSPAKTARGRMTRRAMLVGAVALGGLLVARLHDRGGPVGENALSVQDAHRAALAGEITLIDIRRPDEWARTGLPEGAIAIDMRAPDFTARLLSQVTSKDAAVALICARGVRSRALARRLTEAGFTRVLDVPEGMLGSGAGPGWLKAGLPVTDA